MFKTIINFFKYYNKEASIKIECRRSRGSIKGVVKRVDKDTLTLLVFDNGITFNQKYNVEEVELID